MIDLASTFEARFTLYVVLLVVTFLWNLGVNWLIARLYYLDTNWVTELAEYLSLLPSAVAVTLVITWILPLFDLAVTLEFAVFIAIVSLSILLFVFVAMIGESIGSMVGEAQHIRKKAETNE